MKYSLSIVLVIVTQSFLFSQSHSLTIKLSPIQSQKGFIELSLYDKPSNFPKVGKTFKMVRIKPIGKQLTYTFKGLKPGKYAVCTYHDENQNNVCDKNMFGIPTEAYAFSRNYRPVLSTPTFSQCSVEVIKNTSLNIKMVY